MKTNTFINKIKHNPFATIGGGAVIENKTTGEVLDIFKSGVSASVFWVKVYKRNPDYRVVPMATLFNYLSEKKILRDVWAI
jgi:hypothetical protein